jgi:hypothetical protein
LKRPFRKASVNPSGDRSTRRRSAIRASLTGAGCQADHAAAAEIKVDAFRMVRQTIEFLYQSHQPFLGPGLVFDNGVGACPYRADRDQQQLDQIVFDVRGLFRIAHATPYVDQRKPDELGTALS